jgi:predicted GH43/DUF377 family glycosyl hydrolase
MGKNIMLNRYSENPIIKRTPNTFHSIHAANPDLLYFRGKYFFYFRGQGSEKHDQLAVAFMNPDNFDGVHMEMYSGNPIIKVGESFSDYDSNHILDPASVVFNDKVFLYYSAHPMDKEQKFSTALAISNDGIVFNKVKENPVIKSAICPEVLLHNGILYLFYQKLQKEGYFRIFRSESLDGIHFSNEVDVFGPSGIEGAFDKFSISTVRIVKEGDYFMMIYGGCNKYFDYPIAFGLARSKDLQNWERYPGNPFFERGKPGEWDEGAMWFATTEKINSKYYMWYEGVGSGMGLETDEARKYSLIAREEDYGGYAETSFSQIGLAILSTPALNW